jgi:hypothetical protein
MKYIFTIAFLFAFLFLKAQDHHFTQPVLTATILAPGVSYETPIANKFTAKFKTVVSAGVAYSRSSSLGTSYSLSAIPTASAELRYHYNFQQRIKAHKNTSHNSANYVAVAGKYAISYTTSHFYDGRITAKSTSYYPNAGIVWGFQRNYRNRLSLDINIGPSISSPLIYHEFDFIGNFTLGIWLGKKTE